MSEIDRKLLLEKLHDSSCNVKISFLKKDNSTREMNCSLSQTIIPQVEYDESKPRKPRVHNEDVQSVYDVDVGEWRSFRWDRLVSYEISEVN